MKVRLVSPPWGEPELTEDVKHAIEIINDNIWREASINFYAERAQKERAKKPAPKGMQKYLNDILKQRFQENEWEGESGYFFKNQTWIRITFRHQMSLGSDIIDAIKVCKKEGMKVAVILAANQKTLKLISPNDAPALVSFEKLERELLSLEGALDIPLIIGELSPLTSASTEINSELLKDRPRDLSVPYNYDK